jgi:hypothetical protein
MPGDRLSITKACDWQEWKQTCAYSNCNEDSRSRLGKFGLARIYKWLSRIEGMAKQFSRSGNPEKEAWHWLDTYIIQKDSRGRTKVGGAKIGKACKEWLFDCEGLRTVQDIERYFTNGFFRAAAKEYAKNNSLSSISLNQPLAGAEDGTELGDLLPISCADAGQKLDFSEFINFITQVLDSEFLKLKEITKVALLGSALDISLDNEVIKKLTGKGKSALYDQVKRANIYVLEEIKTDSRHKEYPISDDKLGWLIESSLHGISENWGRNPENPASVLFELV